MGAGGLGAGEMQKGKKKRIVGGGGKDGLGPLINYLSI